MRGKITLTPVAAKSRNSPLCPLIGESRNGSSRAGPRPDANMLRTLEIWGDPQERGRRHGQTLGADIRLLRRAILTYLARISLYAGALPLYGLLTWLARGFWPYIPPHLQQEMVALAAGAEVSLGGILLLNVVDDLANNSPRCSALAVGDRRTARGDYLMGRNLDYPVFTEYLSRLQTLFLISPHQGQRLASLAWPGYVGVCTGINASGVALAQLSSMSRDRTLKGTPGGPALPAGPGRRRHGDRGGRPPSSKPPAPSATISCSAGPGKPWYWSSRPGTGRCAVLAAALLTATNHYQSPAMQALKGRFPPRPPYSVLSSYHFTEAYSQARNRRLQELASDRRLGPSDLQKILADPEIANAGTAVCTVFRPADRTLWVAQGQAPPVNRGPFVHKSPYRS